MENLKLNMKAILKWIAEMGSEDVNAMEIIFEGVNLIVLPYNRSICLYWKAVVIKNV